MRKKYKVFAVQDGPWWSLHIPGIEGALGGEINTQARRINRIESMARDAISLMLEAPADSFDIDIHFEMTDEMRAVLNEINEAKASALQAQSLLAQRTRSAVRYLQAHGLSTRDSGTLIGLSAQRVSQLLSE
ncbi:MAG: hypothetical protein PHN51_01420 [Candidatus Nanopelagicales bacterium]|jgi:DNA-directed RNA polymerase specialized sigma24 family protein|nr:hypothetical protein [Candidatus Nanopelagicales bacterium]